MTRRMRVVTIVLPVAMMLGGCADRADVRLGPLFSFMQKPQASQTTQTAALTSPATSAQASAFADAGQVAPETPAEQAVQSAAIDGTAPEPSPLVVAAGEPVPRGGGRYQVGKAYSIGGKLYQPEDNPFYSETGLASWYGDNFHGRLTANGEVFDSAALTAAHPTLPLPSYVRVTNLENNRSIMVRVNDRGPYSGDRMIDVSERAAGFLGFKRRGTSKVRVDYVEKAPMEGDDTAYLLASYRGDGSATPAAAAFEVAAVTPDLLPAPVPGKPGDAAAARIDAYTSLFEPAGAAKASDRQEEIDAAYLLRSSYLGERPDNGALRAVEALAAR